MLDPNLKKAPFTKEEDEKILELVEKFGNKWTEIASYFPNRH